MANGLIETDEKASKRASTPRELKRSHLTMVEVIGSGEFGQVWKSMLDESPCGGAPSHLTAAKVVKYTQNSSFSSPDAAAIELEQESLIMAQVGSHPNLVSLVGVITRGDPLIVVISYCEHGSLVSLLRRRAVSNIYIYIYIYWKNTNYHTGT